MLEYSISAANLTLIKQCQQDEMDEYYIYQAIARTLKNDGDRKTLLLIAESERQHAVRWQKYTGVVAKPNRKIVWFYTLVAKIFGYTFAIKRMESGEDKAGKRYAQLAAEIPEAREIAQEEHEHEQMLIDMLDEERLQYVGSMVLGLNDALVELTGTLAGLSFALQNNRLIALSGLITGISATFSMTASSYLSAKSENDPRALTSCAYTGAMYLLTVALLIAPYLLLPVHAYLPALISMLTVVALIILGFNYYISVAKSLDFKRRFLEMFVISGSVALLSFAAGLLIKAWLGIDI